MTAPRPAGSAAPAAPLDLLIAHAQLPGAELLLDRARLSALLGREVTIDRVRIKPTAGVLISHRAAGSRATGTHGQDLAEVGWVQLVDSRDKRDGILRRAARGGIEVTEHPAALRAAGAAGADGTGPYLLSGGIDSDPRLGREIHSVLRRLRSGAAPRVLSYNPGRHVVLVLPGSGEVLRVAGRSLDDLLRVSGHWHELGLPTTAQARWKDRPAVLVSDHWGEGDLSGPLPRERSAPATIGLGEVIAQLHAAEVGDRDLPTARLGALVPATTTAAADLLPHRAEQLARLSGRLRGVLVRGGPRVLIHGDLSPDQVLISADGPGIRVVDLDRSGLGPRGADLGTWLASCLLTGATGQAEDFLTGYARHLQLPSAEELAAWTARALLSAALDPLRRYDEGWLPAVERRLTLAEAVLDRPDRLPLPADPSHAPSADAATGGDQRLPLVPARVRHAGRHLRVRRAWADDGRGLPLELETEESGTGAGEQRLRGARLDPATGAVTVFEAGTDPRLPALARVLGDSPGSEIVSHRPGKRAVVRTRDEDGRTRYVKIVRRGRTEKLLAAITRAEPFDGPFRTAEVLASDEETVTFAELPGVLLHEGLSLADGTWRRAWQGTLEAWTAAVGSSRAMAVAGEVHGPVEEAAVLSTWRERAEVVDPAGAGIRARAVEAAHCELARLGEVRHPALIHRDLHDKQILWREGHAPALLDVDTATAGDPALDAANLRAHATWRELQGAWDAERAAVVREEIDRAAGRIGIAPETLAAYESATIARLACVYAFRPPWREAARALAASLVPASSAPATPAGPAVGAAPPGTTAPAGLAAPSPSTVPDPCRGVAAGNPPSPGGAATPLERSLTR